MAGTLRWKRRSLRDENLSQRSVININFLSANNDYKFINHVLGAEQWGPTQASAGASFTNGTAQFNQALGSNGHPNVSIVTADQKAYGGGIWFPSSLYYGSGLNEYWVLRWKGKGRVGFSFNRGSSTIQTGLSSNYTTINSSRWDGTDSYIVFQYTGPTELVSLYVYETDGTLRDLELYRLTEESRRDAGFTYRLPFLNMIKDLCPSAVRFMDWHGGNVSRITRWEYRTPPSNPSFGGGGGGYDWTSSPKYGKTTGTNQYALSGVTGTPASQLMGEIVTCQFGSGMVRAGQLTISAISNGSNGRVTTSAAHGYNTNDIIVHRFSQKNVNGVVTSGSAVVTSTSNSGIHNGMEVYYKYFPPGTTVVSSTATTITMSNVATNGSASVDTLSYQPLPKLHYQPCQITVVDSTNYDINVDTTNYGTFSGNSGNSNQFITLQVGTGNDRVRATGAKYDGYPVIFDNGTVPAGVFGNGYIATNDYKTLIFDKTIAAMKDANGDWVYGVWMFNNLGAANGHLAGVPVEFCVALINEVNALSPAHPINMWLNMPHLGHCSMDPDYDANSNYGIKAVDVALNGSVVAGKTWAGLASPAQLFVEFSNETWNSAGDGFSQTSYLARRGFLRWPNSGGSDFHSMSTLRSSIVMDDIRQSNASTRIHYILGCWGTKGTQAVTGDRENDTRMDGSVYYAADALVTGNPRLNGKAPLTYPHDIIAFASYIDANQGSTWDSVNLSTFVSSWASNVGNAAAQEADCANYVTGQIDLNVSVSNTGNETIGQYLLKLTGFSTKVATFGVNKRVTQYEGGWDHDITGISGSTISAAAPFAICTFSSGNVTISNLNAAYVTALTVGDFVYGYGLPDGCRVASKPTSTSITVTIAPTISTSIGELVGFTQSMAYLRAVKRSQAWSDAYIAWMDAFAAISNGAMPADYILKSRRWGHFDPTSYGMGNVEYGDVAPMMLNIGARNRALAA